MATRKKTTKARSTKKSRVPPKGKKAAAKKVVAPKAKAKAKAAAKAPAKKPIQRRDATGHLNPKYAADLRARSREDRGDDGKTDAFIRKARAHDSLAEQLGEAAVATMTSGEDQSDRLQYLEVEEESGGPFVETSGREELARGTDKSNPKGATREPFPRT